MDNQKVASYGGVGNTVQVGTIRKGNEKQPNKPGEDLQHRLRVNFDLDNDEAREYCKRFEDFYEETGRNIYELRRSEYAVSDIPFILPLPNFDAFDFAYTLNLTYPIGRSDIRGTHWEWLREPGTLDMLVYGGCVQIEHTDPQGRIWRQGEKRSLNPTESVFEFRGKSLMGKSNMSLKLLLPYLKTARYIKLISTSVNDATYIYDQLIWYKSIVQNIGYSWNRLPLTITRRERMITKNYGEQPKREKEWLLSLEIADSDLEAEFMDRMGGDYFSGNQDYFSGE